MAELVGVFAASHTPVMTNFPDAVSESDRKAVFDAFVQLGQAIAATDPQAVIIVSDDHLHNFFLDNLPAFCIGAADEYPTPAEHWLKVEKKVMLGDVGLGAHLIGDAMESGFDPAFSMELTLDHGVVTPLTLAGLSSRIPVVPVMVNCVQPPMPTMQRCLQWGRFIGESVRRYAGLERVALLATGGISHDVATPRMGMVNESFDREFLRLLAAGDDAALTGYARDNVHTAGNGGEEIRNWLVAHGAAGKRRYQSLFYQAVPEWYTGIALGRWDLEE